MKQYILLVLLLLPVYSSAQTAEPLQEWYHINSGGGMTVSGPIGFFPNFDTASNGRHATAMYVIKPTYDITELWFHRYVFDTVGQYRWLWGTRNVTQVDLDNNGVLDYFSGGRIIRGTKNGSPPEDTVLTRYLWLSGSRPYTITNLSEDEYPDILQNLNSDGSGELFSVLVGGPDLANLKYTLFRRRGSEYFIGLLNRRGEDGSFRVVTMSYDTYKIDVYVYMKWTSLVLNEMKTKMIGDSLHISMRTLDSISLNTIETGYQYGELQSGMYYNSKDNKEYLLITQYYKGGNGHVIALDLEEDKFRAVDTAATYNSNLHILNADINSDGYEDWATRKGAELFFYAGQREGIDTIPFGKYTLPCTDQIDFIHVIGDVNNDGINDMAYALLPNAGVEGCFGIILGAARRTVGVVEPVAGYPPTSYRMNQNYPNPVAADRRTTIPVEVDKAQQFSLELWGLDGRFIGRLFEGMLPPGQHELQVALDSYNLSAGLYVVRLTAAEGTIERAILLQ